MPYRFCTQTTGAIASAWSRCAARTLDRPRCRIRPASRSPASAPKCSAIESRPVLAQVDHVEVVAAELAQVLLDLARAAGPVGPGRRPGRSGPDLRGDDQVVRVRRQRPPDQLVRGPSRRRTPERRTPRCRCGSRPARPPAAARQRSRSGSAPRRMAPKPIRLTARRPESTSASIEPISTCVQEYADRSGPAGDPERQGGGNHARNQPRSRRRPRRQHRRPSRRPCARRRLRDGHHRRARPAPDRPQPPPRRAARPARARPHPPRADAARRAPARPVRRADRGRRPWSATSATTSAGTSTAANCPEWTPACRAISASRPLIEGTIRDRVRALPNVSILDGHDIVGLRPSLDLTRITGVRVTGLHGQGSQILPADLVVDATGRGARTPLWLSELGYAEPPTDRVNIDLSYASRLFATPAGAVRRRHRDHHDPLPRAAARIGHAAPRGRPGAGDPRSASSANARRPTWTASSGTRGACPSRTPTTSSGPAARSTTASSSASPPMCGTGTSG